MLVLRGRGKGKGIRSIRECMYVCLLGGLFIVYMYDLEDSNSCWFYGLSLINDFLCPICINQ